MKISACFLFGHIWEVSRLFPQLYCKECGKQKTLCREAIIVCESEFFRRVGDSDPQIQEERLNKC